MQNTYPDFSGPGQKMTPEEALTHFSNAGAAPEVRRQALSMLIGAKFLPKEADHPLVLAGRQHWVALVQRSDNAAEQLLAMAESVRLSQVVKRWMPEIKQQIEPVFASRLPSLSLLSEADDRLNVARACAWMQADWLPQYMADSIAQEETGEKARAELVAALLDRSASLSDALVLLGKAFDQVRPETEVPGDTLGRRLVRTLGALRSAWMDCELETGPDLGVQLHRLVQATLANVGRPQDEKVQQDLAAESLLTIHDIVRTRVSVVADPDMYRLAEYGRSLCGGNWPEALSKPLEKLIRDVSEALVLLGRQGQCDQALLSQLNVLCNHAQRARAIAKEIAASHAELPEHVRDWLEYGRVRQIHQASAAAVEAASSNADESIGMALKEARQARQLRDGLCDGLLSSLELYEPMMTGPVRELLDKVQATAVHVESAAVLRGVDLLGTPGQEVEMSTKFFTQLGDIPRSRVTVRQPAIVRKRSDGVVGEVISKGIVE